VRALSLLRRAGTLAVPLALTFGPAAADPNDPAPSSPAAIASPSKHPLVEIGRVRALSPFCSAVMHHANAAIQPTIANDARIAFTVTELRSIKPDESVLAKSNSARELAKQSSELRAAAKAADAQVKLLRADAAAATDPEQKAELKEFADALGGAVFEQNRVGQQLGSYAVYLDNHQPISDWEQDENLSNVMRAQGAYGNPYVGDAHQYTPYTLTELAKGAADRLTESEQKIELQEGTAETHAEPALKNC
jgi:hypothetical protein